MEVVSLSSTLNRRAIVVLVPVGLFILLGTYFAYYRNEWLGEYADLYQSLYHFILISILAVALFVYRRKMVAGSFEMQSNYQRSFGSEQKRIITAAIEHSKKRSFIVYMIIAVAILSNLFSFLTNILEQLR